MPGPRYHLPFLCPKDLDNATFYGVANGKYIYKCKTCKRAFTDSDAVGANNNNDENKNDEDEYSYSSSNGDSSSSSLLQEKKLKRRTIVTKAQENLKEAAIKLEKARYVSVMKKIDRYGGGLDSPQFRPRTVMGGIISMIFIGAMLAIIILNIIKLAQGARSIVTQGAIQINHYEQSFKALGVIPVSDGSQMDFPVMNVHVQNNIVFFNTDKPPVQKIEMIDNTHYNPTWDTHNPDPPKTRSIYTNVEVPYDCISDPLFKGSHGARDIEVDTVWKNSLPSFFSQSLQSLQLLEMEDDYLATEFFAHNANLYIRFKEDDMADVLPYQLDIALVNAGEVAYYKGPDALNKTWMNNLQTLVKVPQTWNFSYNMQKEGNGFNLIELKSSLGSLAQFTNFTGSSTTNFLNWRFVMYFTSNFNYTNPDKWYCLDDSSGITNVTPLNWDDIKIWARAPNATGNIIEITSDYSYSGPLPADAYMWNLQRVEKVRLISVSGNIWTIERPHPVNFLAFAQESDCLTTVLPNLDSTPPPNWNCPADWYLDSWCDCGCGDVDPMCAMCQQIQDNCLTDGYFVDAGYCSFQTQECANNITDFNGPYVAVSVPCPRLMMPGDDYLRGWYGSTEQYRQATAQIPISQCPWDWMYNGEPNMASDGSIVCNATAEGSLFLDYDISSFIKIPVPPFPDGRFSALFSSGGRSDTFSGSVNPNYTAQFDIDEQQKNCMTSLDKQFVSMGLLISPLKFAQRQLFVIPTNADRQLKANYFFPNSGPYTIQDKAGLLGYIQVTDASCPDESRYMEQGLVMGFSPSSTQVSVSNGTFAYLAQAAYQASTLNISSTLNSFGLQLACCGSPVFAVIGDSEVIKITSVQWNGQQATCNSGAFAAASNEILTLEKPLKGFYQIGATVEANAANSGSGDECDDVALAFPLFSIVTDLKTIRAAGTGEYAPQARSKVTPPIDMDLEVAVFIVPQRNNFSTFLQLCNATGINLPPQDPEGWQLRSDRMASVIGCELNNPPDTADLCNLTDCDSLDRMPPTTGVKFEHVLPLNERWIKPTSQSALLNTPEYYMDVSVVYYFDYTQMDLSVARRFSQNAMHDGDINQNGDKRKFNGEMDFIGKANSTDDETSLYPAPAPVFFMDTVIYADEEKTNTLIDSFYLGYRRFMGWNTDTVKKFYNISLEWPGVGVLDLQPGWNYTFTASLTIQPVYKVGQLEGATLDYWINSTSTSFTKVQTDPNSNQAACRLILTVNKDASVLYNRTTMTFFEFLASVGSAVALLSIGMSLLGVWQEVTGVYPDEEEEQGNKDNMQIMNTVPPPGVIMDQRGNPFEDKDAL